MAQLSRCVKTQATGAAMVRTKSQRPMSWQDAQVAPEISVDPSMLGNGVIASDLKRLKLALRAQATVIRSAVG